MANDKLRHSRGLQNAFIRIAAHELKIPIQPLISIADYSESLNNAEVVGTDDKSRIHKVISNILGNAIKFAENGSISIISAIGKDGSAIIRINDTCQGIAPELMHRLFSKFGVGNAFDTRSGSGLGLFISKEIIDAHGDRLWAENNTDGKGATFTFTIPASR